MFDKNGGGKWCHLVIMLVVGLFIFKIGIFVGEVKVMKKMVIGPAGHNSMMWKGDRTAGMDGFHKAIKFKFMKGDVDKSIWADKDVKDVKVNVEVDGEVDKE